MAAASRLATCDASIPRHRSRAAALPAKSMLRSAAPPVAGASGEKVLGLAPSDAQSQRAILKPIHSADERLAHALQELWRVKTPEDAHIMLAGILERRDDPDAALPLLHTQCDALARAHLPLVPHKVQLLASGSLRVRAGAARVHILPEGGGPARGRRSKRERIVRKLHLWGELL